MQNLTKMLKFHQFFCLHPWIRACDCYTFFLSDVTKAKAHADRLLANLPTHITSNTFSAHQLVQMVAVNLFSLYHSKRKHYSSGSGHPGMRNGGDKNGNSEGSVESRKPKEKGGGNQRTSFDLLFEITCESALQTSCMC